MLLCLAEGQRSQIGCASLFPHIALTIEYDRPNLTKDSGIY